MKKLIFIIAIFFGFLSQGCYVTLQHEGGGERHGEEHHGEGHHDEGHHDRH